jgi:DNA recombination protein RmuC
MTDPLIWLGVALLGLIAILLVLTLSRLPRRDEILTSAALQPQWQQIKTDGERLERELRGEVQASARDVRAELQQSLALFQQTLLAQSGDVARTQNEQIDSFRVQLAAVQQQLAQSLQAFAQSLTQQSQAGSQALTQALAQTRESQDLALRRFAQDMQTQLQQMSQRQEQLLADIRQAVEQRLVQLQEGNEKKLEQMRATVDEKLQSTLQARLDASFAHVAQRLEQVHRGLGEMQTLAQGVGDLKHLLSNVKTRGIFGETQLAGLLEQVFTVDQYEAQASVVPGSRHAVDFAVRLPGRHDGGPALWLPIDAKFPSEDYERLLAAQQQADALGVEAAGRALEASVRQQARSVSEKYIAPPHTTDFAIVFLPSEGLYAEVLRRPGLVESLQRECRVVIAGPTTLLAMLNSLQMGFRTLALEKRSSEVWQVLGAVKTEFGKFGDVLARVKAQTQTVLNTLDSAEQRSRVMGRALKQVQALPQDESARLLPADPAEPIEPLDRPVNGPAV